MDTWEQFKARFDAQLEEEREKLKPLFEKAIKALKMVRIGKGNNELYENDRYTMFIADFKAAAILLCNHSNTTILFAFKDEQGLKNMLKFVEQRN